MPDSHKDASVSGLDATYLWLAPEAFRAIKNVHAARPECVSTWLAEALEERLELDCASHVEEGQGDAHHG